MKNFTPSELRISTTITSNFNSNVDLGIVAKKLPLVNYFSQDIGCIKIEPEQPYPVRGQCKKDVENKTKKKKTFYNQTTIIVRINNNGDMKEVNFKLFSNGRIQMTGVKSIENATDVLEMMIKNLKLLNDTDDDGNQQNAFIEQNDKEISYGKINIHLINSDYSTGFKIKRDVLHSLLVNEYNVYSTYEPCIYPGVNTKYYWNTTNVLDGVCDCEKKCNGKGNGNGDGMCKKVTISIFQSGAIIITGATNHVQLEDAYNFINNILDEHFEDLERTPPPEPLENNKIKIVKSKKKKTVFCKKNPITPNSILYQMDVNHSVMK